VELVEDANEHLELTKSNEMLEEDNIAVAELRGKVHVKPYINICISV
jgi:hypothetical protein